MNLRTKLIIAFLLVALLSTTTGMILAIHSTQNSFNEYLASYALSNIAQWQGFIANYYQDNQTLEGLESLVTVVPRMMGHRGQQRSFVFNEQVVIIDKEGKVVLDTFNQHLGQKAEAKLINEAQPVVVDGDIIGQVVVRVIPPRGVITLEEQFVDSVYRGFIAGGVAAIFFAIVLGVGFANSLVKPIRRLTQVVQDFAKGNWLRRSPITSNNEIGVLSKAFNQMAEQLEKNLKLKQQLVADVSHELRTPITILRGNLESIQAGINDPSPQLILSMHDEVLRLSRLVSELQQLSLIDNNSLPINKQRVDLVGLVNKIFEVFVVEAQAKEIKLNYNFSKEPFYLAIDEDKITQVIINLLTNALRHTPSQGEINLVIEETEGKLPMALIKIIDQGPGILPEEREKIFERFYRLDEARNREQGGMGLGLAIAKGIIEAHGGAILIEENTPQGLIFTIQLPIKE